MTRRLPHFADSIFITSLCLVGLVGVAAGAAVIRRSWALDAAFVAAKVVWILLPLGYFRLAGVPLRSGCYFRLPSGRDLWLILPIWLSGTWLLVGFQNGVGRILDQLGWSFAEQEAGVRRMLERMYGMGPAAGLVLIGPLTAAAEEMVFRGAMLSGFARSFSPGRALIYTSLLFGLLHGLDLYLPRAVATALLGLLFGYCVLTTGSLLTAFLLHTLNNLSFLWLIDRAIVAPWWGCVLAGAVLLVSLYLIGRARA